MNYAKEITIVIVAVLLVFATGWVISIEHNKEDQKSKELEAFIIGEKSCRDKVFDEHLKYVCVNPVEKVTKFDRIGINYECLNVHCVEWCNKDFEKYDFDSAFDEADSRSHCIDQCEEEFEYEYQKFTENDYRHTYFMMFEEIGCGEYKEWTKRETICEDEYYRLELDQNIC